MLRMMHTRFTASCIRQRTTYVLGVQLSLSRCHQSTRAETQAENLKVGHSRFLAEGSATSKWKGPANSPDEDGMEGPAEDYDYLSEGKGKLSPTSSHLFKLIIPMSRLNAKDVPNGGLPTVFLLHPSQPLSHIGRLIAASLAPATPSVSFRCTSPKGPPLEWSDSTDLGDFIHNAARAREFQIHLQDGKEQTTLSVEVPTFANRTRFLRRRLEYIEEELRSMEALKRQCDVEAQRGARKMAVGGLAMLVVYWGGVTRLTFWDLGWEVMEPVTYLSGLSMVIAGYMWFLYQGREVSYSSVLDRSISSRRQALYKAHGFDVEHWADLLAEQKSLHKEISKIAEDYDERRWKGRDEKAEAQSIKDVQEIRDAAGKSGDVAA